MAGSVTPESDTRGGLEGLAAACGTSFRATAGWETATTPSSGTGTTVVPSRVIHVSAMIGVAILTQALQKAAYLVRIGCLLVIAQFVITPQSHGSKDQQISISNLPCHFRRKSIVRIQVTTDAVNGVTFMQCPSNGHGKKAVFVSEVIEQFRRDAFLIKQIVVVTTIKWRIDAVEHGSEECRQHPLKSPDRSL